MQKWPLHGFAEAATLACSSDALGPLDLAQLRPIELGSRGRIRGYRHGECVDGSDARGDSRIGGGVRQRAANRERGNAGRGVVRGPGTGPRLRGVDWWH